MGLFSYLLIHVAAKKYPQPPYLNDSPEFFAVILFSWVIGIVVSGHFTHCFLFPSHLWDLGKHCAAFKITTHLINYHCTNKMNILVSFCSIGGTLQTLDKSKCTAVPAHIYQHILQSWCQGRTGYQCCGVYHGWCI